LVHLEEATVVAPLGGHLDQMAASHEEKQRTRQPLLPRDHAEHLGRDGVVV
jgi:hypothetical protein